MRQPTRSSSPSDARPTAVLAIWTIAAAIAFAGIAATGSLRGESSLSELEKGFLKPPPSARPWVYWFWLNGNITREGIAADLEAMRRAGIGGVLIMEVDQGAPVGPIDFMGREWRELFRHAVAEGERLGLEVNMNDDAGWNGSGGPWIKPEQSMQVVVWSETSVEGPKRFEGTLPQPKAVAGFYRDIGVLAFPATGKHRIENIQVKAAYKVGGVGSPAEGDFPAESAIDRARIVDLGSRMDGSGRLVWDAPPGSWTVLRLGHTSTGVENAPSPATGRGLECDKLGKAGIEANFAGMMEKLISDVGPAAGRTLVSTHIDSWENGSQNWTRTMEEEFRKRRGYDLRPFLPVFTGRVVTSLEISERFLWDLRRTISEMVVENYAGRCRELARARGLRLSIEAYGSPCDVLPYAGEADEPMCEFWIGGGALETVKGMASAVHAYGKPILGAEAFTADDRERWREHPASIKALGDRAFCDGVNRFVFHRYALQPWLDRRPGMTMGPWGLHYERTQTWWERSAAWHEYLARCQFLLRQGLFVADICYLQPEAPPQGFSGHDRRGYDWDEACAEVVLRRMGAKDGRIVLPDGMSYRLLVLPHTRTMTPALLGKIVSLVRDGATVLGPRPQKSPSLTGHPACDDEVKRLAAELWGEVDGNSVKERRFGQGRIAWGMAPEMLLAQAGVRPDFSSRAHLRSIHRSAGGAEIYFVSNPEPHDVTAAGTFRVAGKVPELWWPDSGRIERAPAFEVKDGATRILLPLGPSGSVFVVFREAAGKDDPAVTLSRDGKEIWSVAAERASKVVVLKAEYGIPGDAARTRDVRARIQRKVDGGETSFAVSEMAGSDDPAPNAVKTLSVEYSIGEERFKVRAQDGEAVRMTGEAANLVVEKAVYGVLDDPQRTRDVRAKVQRIVDAGEMSFQVARMAAGDDPAFGIVKTLIVEYTVSGRRLKASGTDPETIVLGPPERTERMADVFIGGDGRLTLEAWQPGRYEIATASGKVRRIEVASVQPPVEIGGPWEVRFPPGWGAPESAILNGLASLSEHADKGVRHFSGTAVYRKTVAVPPGLLGEGRRVDLDLGDVQVMAEVKLNGKDLGLLWKPPYRIDATAALRTGENALEIQVTNLWPNRLVGDENLPEDSARNPDGTLKEWPAWIKEGKPSPAGRFTFTSWRLWKKGDALLRSGLLGPVALKVAERRTVPHPE